MPPSKREKRTHSTTEASSSSGRYPSRGTVNAKEDVDAPAGADVSSRPTTESVKSNDIALLDEEEIPSDFEDAATEPAEKQRKVAYADGGYNALKQFQGKVYSGMAIGGSHTWNYDQGVWKETKEEPDLWRVDYKTTKRRAKKAPSGSGAPVGTSYHWLIVAHQHVTKVDANTYDTHLVGSKYKLAHKAASSNSWSVPTIKAQREREIDLLDDAKRRIQGLPPVLAGEKVKVEKPEKGQQKLDTLFAKAGRKGTTTQADVKKRKRGEGNNGVEGDAKGE